MQASCLHEHACACFCAGVSITNDEVCLFARVFQAQRTAASGRQDAARTDANANVSNAVIDMLTKGDLYAGASGLHAVLILHPF